MTEEKRPDPLRWVHHQTYVLHEESESAKLEVRVEGDTLMVIAREVAMRVYVHERRYQGVTLESAMALGERVADYWKLRHELPHVMDGTTPPLEDG